MSEKRDLLPYETIVEAIGGDVEAINQVLGYFEPFIDNLCLRKVEEPGQKVRYQIDAFMKLRIQSKLVEKILTFRIRPEELS